MDLLVERLEAKLSEWKPNVAAIVKERIQVSCPAMECLINSEIHYSYQSYYKQGDLNEAFSTAI